MRWFYSFLKLLKFLDYFRTKKFLLDWQKMERVENDLLIRNSIFCLRNQRPKAAKKQKLVIMTICNTGSLATSSFGTALGVIVHSHRLGLLDLAIALETRPFNQGSRLTAYELKEFGVPFRKYTFTNNWLIKPESSLYSVGIEHIPFLSDFIVFYYESSYKLYIIFRLNCR